MTQRKHIDSGVKCAGCGREFGIIQASHIVNCAALKVLGVTSRKEYTVKFGSAMSESAKKISSSTITKFNSSLSASERKQNSASGHKAALIKHPDLCRSGGINGAKTLWNKPGQKERHAKRLVNMNLNGFNKTTPNKLESRFWDLIGRDKISYSSFRFWKTISRNGVVSHITPDFNVGNTNAVIEVYGDYWHRGENPDVRISEWKSAGIDCIVIWESDINNRAGFVKNIVTDFISKKLHECGTSDLTI